TYIMIHHGWRSSFWICAVIGLAAGLVWYLASRNTPEEHPLVSPSELALIRSGLTLGIQSSGAGQAPTAAVPWGKILRHRDVWAITLSYFSYVYVAWIFFAWFFIYL